VTSRDDQVKLEPFERAKLPMILAAVGVAGGLAIAGSVERTAGGAIVLAAWVLGIASLHRLGRAGSVKPEVRDGKPETGDEARPEVAPEVRGDATDDEESKAD
jgi:hypothetical protein